MNKKNTIVVCVILAIVVGIIYLLTLKTWRIQITPINSTTNVASLINTRWVPDDEIDAVVYFLNTKENDPAHEKYDYEFAADSRSQEKGYWYIDGNRIIPIVTEVFATPQYVKYFILAENGNNLLIYTERYPEPYRFVKWLE